MVRVSGRELFVVYFSLRALPSLRFQVSNNNGFRPFCLLTAQGSTKGKPHERRTAHRKTHQGRIGTQGLQHHMVGRAAWLLAPKRLQNLQPPVDLYRPAAQNLRPARLRLLPMLLGMVEQQGKRVNFVFSWRCKRKTRLHRIHIHLHLNGLKIGILLEQTKLIGNQLLDFLGVVIAAKLHHHLLDIQIFDP